MEQLEKCIKEKVQEIDFSNKKWRYYLRIKSKDIAKVLGVSTATVSLAINGKAGVNEETRRKILEYVRELEEEQIQIRKQKIISKDGCVLFLQYVKHGFIMNQKWETNNSFFMKLEKEVKNSGYQLWCRMFLEKKETIESLLLECKEKKVKGIYIMAAEMQQADVYPFLSLKVPIVLGDNLVYIEGVDCFLIDNKEGIRRGVDYLVEKGHSDIVYLAETIDIYNFLQRREAFVEEMKKQECGDATSRICYLGNTVEEVYEAMKEFLNKKMKKTTAFILESSIVSLGVSKALLERNIEIPRKISLLGFDALPPVSLLGVELTLVKGTHTKRHISAIKHLLRHMEDNENEIVSVYYKTKLIEGNSVFDKTKYIYK